MSSFSDPASGSDDSAGCGEPVAIGSAGVDSCLFASSAAGVGGSEPLLLEKRAPGMAGDLFDGTVLLRWTPELVGVLNAWAVGLGMAVECRECLDEVDTFRRIAPYLRKLSAPALEAAEADRPSPDLFRPGVVGVRACGVEGPLSTCLTVPSSTAVPSIPIRK